MKAVRRKLQVACGYLEFVQRQLVEDQRRRNHVALAVQAESLGAGVRVSLIYDAMAAQFRSSREDG